MIIVGLGCANPFFDVVFDPVYNPLLASDAATTPKK